ncbi:MAG: cadherin domain-containing protein [Bacteroidales bacterium]|nr:cadherin domain-containing protein [Bacteroidales bacterium]
MKNTGIAATQERTNIRPKLTFIALTVFLLLIFSTLLFSATVYIDPSNNASGQNGSISNPYNSWTDFSLVSGNTYLQKRGTTYSSSNQILISSKTNILIGAYGTGNRPKFSYTGSGYAFRVEYSSGCTIEQFEVNGNTNAFALIGLIGTSGSYNQNNKVDNCLLYNAHNTSNAGFGVYSFYNNNLEILNTEINNVALDGMYLRYTPNITIGYCNVYNINRRYFANPDEEYSSGDGIQLDGNYNGFHIHHTTINRTNGAGNKFNLILNSGEGISDNATGIIEYCEFQTDENVTSAVHIERGNGIITRYNTFKGITQGIRIAGAYTTNNLIHNNVFQGCSKGIGIGYTYPTVGPATNTKVYNNVFYNVSTYHIWVDRANVQSRNNIHMRTSDAGVALYNYGGGSWTISNNCYSSSAVTGTPGAGSYPVIGNPLFINPATGNFNIQSSSPCLNKGTNVGISFDRDGTAIFQGTAPEIGSYESISSSGANLPPVISNQSFSVNENSVNGTIAGTVVASDPNAGQSLTYSITGGNTNNAFSINAGSGVISVANSLALNYETITSFALTVRVTDNGIPVIYTQATVTVNLLNQNESPVISNQAFSISQNPGNGVQVGIVQATDPDSGQILNYSITAGNTNTCFAINSSTGTITVINSTSLTPQTITLTVRATDNGSPVLYSQATITITVTALQGNLPPVISNQAFTAVQNAPMGTVVGNVVATDPNSGQTLTYSITGGNTYTCFVINSATGVISVYSSANLNPMTFSLTVRVTDNGSPVLYSQATVTITVTASQGNLPPVINNQAFSVLQNSPMGTVVGNVVATDPNSGQTLTYSITGGNLYTCFLINSSTGAISVYSSANLNPMTFNLTVRATDNGSPSLYSSATVTITVTALQGNLPPVINNQGFTVIQNAPMGTVVGTVLATDPNTGQTLTYSITGGNLYTCFLINSSTGVISVYSSAYLNPMTFSLTVRATDNGSPSLYSQATVTITVTPSNQPPVINNQAFTTVQNAPMGTIVGTVLATDPNTSQTLTYSITGGNLYTCFLINSSTGVISVYSSANLYPMTFNLTVRATDNGSPSLYSSATVTITVTALQGNQPPVINNQTFTVVQNAPMGTPVGTVVAADPNTGQTLTYSITGGNLYTCFLINSSTGVISVYSSAYLNPMTFNLTVRVTDNGTPVLYSQAVVTVYVVPNATMSNFQSQEFTFSGELLSGATVGTVIVNNQAENQTFLYNFPDNAYGPGFEIDSNTGVIIINNPENITSGINQFRVKITDSSDPEMSYEGSIIIHVSKESLTNSSILKEGIPEITSDQLEVVLWPNPSPDGIFRLSIKDTESVNEIQAIDFSGKIIQSFISESSDNIVIDLSSQPKGMYILKIQSGKKLKNLKAIIN